MKAYAPARLVVEAIETAVAAIEDAIGQPPEPYFTGDNVERYRAINAKLGLRR